MISKQSELTVRQMQHFPMMGRGGVEPGLLSMLAFCAASILADCLEAGADSLDFFRRFFCTFMAGFF
jgi:hypothetical protein